VAFDLQIRVLQPSFFFLDQIVCRGDIRDSDLPETRSALIQPPWIVPAGVGGSTGSLTTWHTLDTAHAVIGGYRRLVSVFGNHRSKSMTVTMPDVGPFPEEVLFDEFATASGDMDGVDSVNETTTFVTRARRVLSGTEITNVRVDVYHREAEGGETLLGSFTTPDLSTSFVDYSGDVTANRAWADGDFTVFKYIARNQGTPT